MLATFQEDEIRPHFPIIHNIINARVECFKRGVRAKFIELGKDEFEQLQQWVDYINMSRHPNNELIIARYGDQIFGMEIVQGHGIYAYGDE